MIFPKFINFISIIPEHHKLHPTSQKNPKAFFYITFPNIISIEEKNILINIKRKFLK